MCEFVGDAGLQYGEQLNFFYQSQSNQISSTQ